MNLIPQNSQPNHDPSIIEDIIQSGDVAKLEKLVAQGYDFNQIDEDYLTPLETAADEGNLKIVKILLAAGASPHQGEFTPLYLAATEGHREIVDMILAIPNYVQLANKKKFHEAFVSASFHSEFDIVKAFIEIGADVNTLVFSSTALENAVIFGHLETVKLLMAAGAKIDVHKPKKDKSDYCLLLENSRQGNAEITEILIKAGANINARNAEGMTPLIIAAAEGNAEVAAKLIEAGADLEAKDENGNTALMYASLNNANEATDSEQDLAILENKEVGDSLQDKFGRLLQLEKIMQNSAKNGRIAIAQMLRVMGASEVGVSKIDFVKAAEKGNLIKVKNLIKAGVDVNSKDTFGKTALIYACRENYLEIVKSLIVAGADVNLADSDRTWTPLIEAAYKGNQKIVSLLIEAGVDVNFYNGYFTAINYAQSGSHREIIQILRDAGARNYHEFPLAKMRGIDGINCTNTIIAVQAEIDDVAQALCQIRKATIWEKDMFEKEVELTDICFRVFQYPGHSWTLIREENVTVDYDPSNFQSGNFTKQWANKINQKDAQKLSEILPVKVIYFSSSKSADSVYYNLCESGESQEMFNYYCDLNLDNEPEAEANECVIMAENYYFRSKLRQITVDDIPKYQYEPESDLDEDEEDYENESESIDEFKFVDDFIKSQDAYIPGFHRSRYDGAGQKIILEVIGYDPEDIERMDFVAVAQQNYSQG